MTDPPSRLKRIRRALTPDDHVTVVLDNRQDYFGRTVNIAARVQGLADSRSILATGSVVKHPGSCKLLETIGLDPVPHQRALRGVAEEMAVYEIP